MAKTEKRHGKGHQANWVEPFCSRRSSLGTHLFAKVP